jgi:hypothetical protein
MAAVAAAVAKAVQEAQEQVAQAVVVQVVSTQLLERLEQPTQAAVVVVWAKVLHIPIQVTAAQALSLPATQAQCRKPTAEL